MKNSKVINISINYDITLHDECPFLVRIKRNYGKETREAKYILTESKLLRLLNVIDTRYNYIQREIGKRSGIIKSIFLMDL